MILHANTLKEIASGGTAFAWEPEVLAHEVISSRRLIERVRRWVSDHPIDPDHPCHCGLCTALRRYDSEVGQ